MMSDSNPKTGAQEGLFLVKNRLLASAALAGRPLAAITLVAVSKTFPPADIEAVIGAGQKVFGENRVQEAKAKWPGLRLIHPDIELHLIGPLQTNKVVDAVRIFDVIQSVDRPKLAKALANEMRKQGVERPCFIQVNIGNEPQKAGVKADEAAALLSFCREIGLPVVGLMCIPPADERPEPYFAQMRDLATALGLSQLSMGMSGDFEAAIAAGATHVRVGSAIFGYRPRA